MPDTIAVTDSVRVPARAMETQLDAKKRRVAVKRLRARPGDE